MSACLKANLILFSKKLMKDLLSSGSLTGATIELSCVSESAPVNVLLSIVSQFSCSLSVVSGNNSYRIKTNDLRPCYSLVQSQVKAS